MAARIAARPLLDRCGQQEPDDRQATEQELLATLVAALEQALLAARRLRGRLDHAAGRHAAAAHLEQAVRRTAASARHDVWALAPPPPAARRGATGVSAAPPGPAGLTCREMEVLRLLAAGHSTRQIAQALFLSPRTVQRHVANAYLKIGAHNKADATAYATAHGLLAPCCRTPRYDP